MAASWAKEASSSSSSIAPQCKYDVFVSFSGDTRKNFTSHLFAALKRHHFSTFKDDMNLNRGEDIGSELPEAIEESRIAIIVFSKNYAASKWCLNELVKIMECRKTFQQTVLPIFYDVLPSDVRDQKGSFAEAFAKHEEQLKESSDGKVEKWRASLSEAANLSGWDLKNVANGDEAKLIEKIVEEVGNILDCEHLSVADHPVGLEDHVQELNMLLGMESNNNDVCFITVLGIGGIGKTTIAKKLYNHIHKKFDASSFLADVRETWKQPNGLFVLQRRLLSDILKNETHPIKDSHQGKEVIKRRALCQKVLLVLDDVDDIQQLMGLAIDRGCFGSGSRIIITTRDLSSLNLNFDVDKIYTPKELDKEKSLQLFSWYAFREDHPKENYVELSNQVVDCARGLPLALEILGSFLFPIRSILEWESAIEKLKKIPHEGIQAKLKISFDSLSDDMKNLFLDIACFFYGMNRHFTIKMLKACELNPEFGFRVLLNRCLIKYGPNNKLVMHDLLRDMGREIVRTESNDEPGRRSRLWHHKDVLEVLKFGTGTEAVKGLVLNFPGQVQVDAKAFKKMNTLWLLHLNNVHLSVGYKHIFRRLLWLSWNGFALECLPSNLSMEKLVVLDLRYNRLLKQVWKGTMILDKLKFLYLSHCYYLTKTPDFSGLNNLEELLLNDCIRLVEVDESIGCLNRLVVLEMANCKKFGQLPLSILMLKSLEYLDLSGCSKLRNFTALPRKNMDSIGMSLRGSSLKTLKMNNCNLSCLPSEIGSLISLVYLDASYNKLCALPDNICNLTSLQNLNMSYNNVSHLPSKIGGLISLTHLDLSGNKLCTLPESIGSLTHLESLNMKGCNLSHLPTEIGRLISLKNLDLGILISLTRLDVPRNKLCTLPDSICNLTCLTNLSIEYCELISELPSEFGRLISLKRLCLGGNNLSTLPNSFCNLSHLENLSMVNCKLSELPTEFGRLISLKRLHLNGNNLSTLPDSFCNLPHLKYLLMENCKLSELPSEFGRLISLEKLHLSWNNLSTLPDSFGNLSHLEDLLMENYSLNTLPNSFCNLTCLRNLFMNDCKLSDLPSEFGSLNSLRFLDISENNFRTLPDGICKLTTLIYLNLNDCTRLQSLPELPVSLIEFDASGCVSLENIEFKSIAAASGDKRIVMQFDGCNKLNENNNFANNLVEEFVQGYKDRPASEYTNWSWNRAETIICGGEIPKWFEYQSAWQYLSVEKPCSRLQFSIKSLINRKVVGLVLCVVFTGIVKEDTKHAFDYRLGEIENIYEEPLLCRGVCCRITGEDQMWLLFGRTWGFESDEELDILLTPPDNTPIVLFKKCAASFVYKDDENISETDDEASTQYTSSPYPSKRRRRS